MKYRVTLTLEARRDLEKKISSGVHPSREICHARILLLVDEAGPNSTDEAVGRTLNVDPKTVYRVRRRYVEKGLDASLSRSPQPPRPDKRKLTDETEARLIAMACSKAPEGRSRWTLRLLADRSVELGFSLSRESVRKALKKTNCAPTESSAG